MSDNHMADSAHGISGLLAWLGSAWIAVVCGKRQAARGNEGESGKWQGSSIRAIIWQRMCRIILLVWFGMGWFYLNFV